MSYGPICNALKRDAKRCRRPGRYQYNYHGSHELYDGIEDTAPAWVAVRLCLEHLPTHAKNHPEYKEPNR